MTVYGEDEYAEYVANFLRKCEYTVKVSCERRGIYKFYYIPPFFRVTDGLSWKKEQEEKRKLEKIIEDDIGENPYGCNIYKDFVIFNELSWDSKKEIFKEEFEYEFEDDSDEEDCE